MRYKDNYSRLVADRMFEWQSDDWIVDKNGRLKLRDDDLSYDREIETTTISPLYSTDDIEA